MPGTGSLLKRFHCCKSCDFSGLLVSLISFKQNCKIVNIHNTFKTDKSLSLLTNSRSGRKKIHNFRSIMYSLLCTADSIYPFDHKSHKASIAYNVSMRNWSDFWKKFHSKLRFLEKVSQYDQNFATFTVCSDFWNLHRMLRFVM